jgi:hypothetical protein
VTHDDRTADLQRAPAMQEDDLRLLKADVEALQRQLCAEVPTDLVRTLDAHETAISDISADLARLRRELAAEVRTRSLVVEDVTGFERVTITTGRDFGELAVRSRPTFDGDEPSCGVTLVANEEDVSPLTGLFVNVKGNHVASLSIDDHAVPHLRVAEDTRSSVVLVW